MATLRLSNAVVSSTWRPHQGSTLHRYSLALDLKNLTGLADISPTETASVSIHLHVQEDDANPTHNGPTNDPTVIRKRTLSKVFHRYLAEERAAGRLGWLGGPWPLTRSQVGLSGNTQFIATDSGHTHHVHVTVGIDQS